MKTITLPEFFNRWRKAHWPPLIGRGKTLHGEEAREAEQTDAKQGWEYEGGAIKPARAPGRKIPL